MLFSYNWLKEYVDLPSPRELADMLTMTGTEVESVTGGAAVKGVVTAEILSIGKHPDADKLQLCEVRTDKAQYTIVCGARNMKPGDRVPLALAGAELPNGTRIKLSKIRGIESQGMMCSEVELGIKDKSEGLLILPPETPLGRDINEVLGLGDSMLEVGITPNRADLLSIKGLSREISAVTERPFKEKKDAVTEEGGPVETIASVKIAPGAPCRRYTARVIENVSIGPSTEPIRVRLEAHGIRPVNNVVDVTNYVMLEMGQPLHAFDLDKLNGRSINVRLAASGEAMETIDGKTRTLADTMLVIADARVPVAIAGIMGGKGSEVSDNTQNILLESAWFEPWAVRRSARKMGLSTDSSYRFERQVDIEGVSEALDRAAYLINKFAGGKTAKGVIDIYPGRSKPAEIGFRVKRASELLGVSISAEEAEAIFRRLGMLVRSSGEGGENPVLTVTPPSYRGDLKIETDLMEEAARIYGYNNIPTTLPVARLIPGSRGKYTDIKKNIRKALITAGFLEVINYSFTSPGILRSAGPAEAGEWIKILNPLTEDQSVMRDSLLPTLLENLRRNLARKNEQLRIFEVAPVFLPDGKGKLPDEEWRVAGLLHGLRWGEAWNYPKEEFDFYDIKGIVERLFEAIGIPGGLKAVPTESPLFHPGKSAVIMAGEREAGVMGEVHPDIKSRFDLKRPAFAFEINIDAIIDLSGRYGSFSALPKFPESVRDIAFLVGENTRYQEIINAIQALDTKIIERVELFDVYCGKNIPPGKRSIALRIVYRAKDRTLTHQEVEDMHLLLGRELSDKFNAEVRGETHT